MHKARLTKTIIVFSVIVTIVLVGAIWAITQAVKSTDYDKTTAVVSACYTEKINDEDVVTKVEVSCSINGATYNNVIYIGDLNRCYEGLQMKVYYKKSKLPPMYVYSKSSDLGFALIMLGGGLAWLVLAIVAVYCLNRSGFYRYVDKTISAIEDEDA